MAIILNDNIKINTGKPSEAKYLNLNTNAPYTATTQVNTLIPISERYRGLTVLINNEEYWYRNGVSNLDLVLKTTAGSGTGDRIEREFYQSSHNFAIGEVVEYSGGTFVKALAVEGRNSEIIGWVSDVIDSNGFKIVLNGYVNGIIGLGLSANTTYYLSSTVPGSLTPIEPVAPNTISKPILTTLTNNDAIIFHYRGIKNTTGNTGGGTGFTYAVNIGSGQSIYDNSIPNTLQFRTLKSGDNISVVTVGDEIEFNLTGISASNGLTALGNNIVLGGTLTGDTYIDGSYGLYIGTNTPLSEISMISDSNIEIISNSSGDINIFGNGGGVNIFNTNIGYIALITDSGGINLNTTNGNISLNGGGGSNISLNNSGDISFNNSTANISLSNITGDISLSNTGDISLNGGGNISLNGSGGDISLNGSGGNINLNGGGGNINLNGSGGDISLNGGGGNITLNGDSGGNISLNGDSGVELTTNYFSILLGGSDNPNNTVIIDNRSGTNQSGIEYGDDYSANFVNRSLVDKEYVDNTITSSVVPLIQIVSANTTVTGDTILVITSGSSITIDLPASPSNGDKVIIKDSTGSALTNNITINGNGNNIEGSATATINTNRGSIGMMFSSYFDEWQIIAFVN